MPKQRTITRIVSFFAIVTLALILAPFQTSGQTESPIARAVSIDAAVTGEPISPYIYGLFIEHQGRCIYGGIWAEMLEDRKFFYSVNYYFPYGEQESRSPWRAVPYDTVVTMDEERAYVGEHSPRILLDGVKSRGIVQERLALQQGRDYTGRIVLSGDNTVTVEVSLVWGDAADERQTVAIAPLTTEYATTQFPFAAGADIDDGRLEIIGQGEGNFYVGAVSLLPADNVSGIRADTLALLQELGGTVVRWPGGSFATNYDWRNAVGDPDRRAPRINRAYWSEDIESYDFGPDEFMTLVELLGAEPYIAVSAFTEGDIEWAAAEVEYFNGAADTPMGQWRAANGHPEPYNARFWGIGNETFFFAPLDEYVVRHNEIAAAMWAVDPTITIIAVGGAGSPGAEAGQGDWSAGMLTYSITSLNAISEHIYSPWNDDPVLHSTSVAQGVRHYVEVHRQFRQQLPSLQGLDVRLVFDEWNYSWENQPQIYGEAAPRYPFKNALGIAVALHEMFRNSDMILMANAHAVNVHGHIKTTQTDAAFEATGLAFLLYRQHFGTLPLTVAGNTFPLDVVAAWSDDRQYLTVAVVNPTLDSDTLTLNLTNAGLTGAGQWWSITADPLTYNEPGQAPRVEIVEQALDSATTINVPPLSVNLYRWPAQ